MSQRSLVRRRVLLLVTLLTGSAALAQPGALDPTFGDGDGYVITDLSATDFGTACALQPDGKVVVAGWTGAYPTYHVLLARYLPDGVPDPDFGEGGTVVFTAAEYAADLVVQPDEKIVVAVPSLSGPRHFRLARFLPDGAPDPDFGTAGVVETDAGGVQAGGYGLALQPDGRIVLSGYGPYPWFAMVRYLPDGTLDASFGDGGIVRTQIHSSGGAYATVLHPDGRIVVAISGPYDQGPDSYLAQFLPDGSPDPSFGKGGLAELWYATDNVQGIASILLQPDGKVVASESKVILRFLADGTPDDTFGGDGYVTETGAAAIALQPDGKIVGVGHLWCGTDCSDVRVERLLPDGTPDPSFGDGGSATADLGGMEVVQGVALQPDGRLLTCGHTGPPAGGTTDLVVARFLGDAGGVAVEPPSEGPSPLSLSAPSPHPFHGSARLTLSVPSAQAVRVALYDALGREVAVLLDDAAEAGAHTLMLDGSDLAPGVYVVRAEGPAGAAARRVIRY